MTNEQRPVWFITGCSTGFGRELATRVARRRRTRGRDGAGRDEDQRSGCGPRRDRASSNAWRDGCRCHHACGEADRSDVRADRCAGEQRRLRPPRCHQGRRGRAGARDVRHERVRPRQLDEGGAAGQARAPARPHHQPVVDRRPGQLCRGGLLPCDKICRRKAFRLSGDRAGTVEHQGDHRRPRVVPHRFRRPIDRAVKDRNRRLCRDGGHPP